MKQLGVAIIGAGRIAHVHLDAYLTMPDVKVVAVCDPDSGRANALAGRAAADATSDVAALLKRPDVDAIDICTPTDTHENIAVAAFGAGKHVCCQKPFALDLESCDRIITAAKAAGKVLVVPYMSRHAPLTVRARELIAQGEIGRPLNAHYHMLCPSSVALTRWFHDEQKSGGIVVDTLTHGVDLLNWYFGPVGKVGALATSSADAESDDIMWKNDNVAMIASYRNGTVATLRVSWSAPLTFPITLLDVIGTKGALRLETPSAAISYHRLTLFPAGDKTVTWESSGRGHNEKQRYFIDVIRGKADPTLSTPEDAREALRITLAARSAARTGSIVTL